MDTQYVTFKVTKEALLRASTVLEKIEKGEELNEEDLFQVHGLRNALSMYLHYERNK